MVVVVFDAYLAALALTVEVAALCSNPTENIPELREPQ